MTTSKLAFITTILSILSLVGTSSADLITLTSLNDGERIEGTTINGVVITSTQATALGATIYNTGKTNRNPDPDPDLFIEGGPNIIIAQSPDNSSMTGNIFDTPNDFAGGETITFDLTNLPGGGLLPTEIDPLLMVDINGGGRATITLHSGSATRFFKLPNHWTSGAFPTNFAWVDVSSTVAPVGPGSNGNNAIVGSTGGFDNSFRVDKIDVKFFGSGGVGFVAQIPEPASLLLCSVLGLGCFLGQRRRSLTHTRD